MIAVSAADGRCGMSCLWEHSSCGARPDAVEGAEIATKLEQFDSSLKTILCESRSRHPEILRGAGACRKGIRCTRRPIDWAGLPASAMFWAGDPAHDQCGAFNVVGQY
jgi:hypothetical protein